MQLFSRIPQPDAYHMQLNVLFVHIYAFIITLMLCICDSTGTNNFQNKKKFPISRPVSVCTRILNRLIRNSSHSLNIHNFQCSDLYARFNGNEGVHHAHKNICFFFAYMQHRDNITKISVNWIFAGEHAETTFIFLCKKAR